MLKKIFPMYAEMNAPIDRGENTFGTCSFTYFPTCYLSYPNSKQDRSVARPSTNILRVEGGVRLAHEGRLQHVPTLTILQEPALV